MKLKGPAHSKNENLYFLASAQTKRMQQIVKEQFSKKHWSSGGHDPHWSSGPVRVMTLKLVAFA